MPVAISWTSAGDVGRINLQLWRRTDYGEGLSAQIATGAANTGIFSWLVPEETAAVPPGDRYFVRASSSSNSAVSADSKEFAVSSAAAARVLRPGSFDIVLSNASTDIEVQVLCGQSAEVRLDLLLYRGDREVSTIATGVNVPAGGGRGSGGGSSGSSSSSSSKGSRSIIFPWDVSTQTVSGDDYRVVARATIIESGEEGESAAVVGRGDYFRISPRPSLSFSSALPLLRAGKAGASASEGSRHTLSFSCQGDITAVDVKIQRSAEGEAAGVAEFGAVAVASVMPVECSSSASASSQHEIEFTSGYLSIFSITATPMLPCSPFSSLIHSLPPLFPRRSPCHLWLQRPRHRILTHPRRLCCRRRL